MASTSNQASTSTSTSTSLEPSSTDHSGNNNNSYNQAMNGIFTTNGSPTLVVAFLAIGLFTVTMAALFGWRKMHRGRLLVHPVRPVRARTGKIPVVLGEKPALWEMWTRRKEDEDRDREREEQGPGESGATIDLKWENITPFCATLFLPVLEEPCQARSGLTKDAARPQNPPRTASFAVMSAIRQHFRPSHPTPTSPAPPPPSEPEPPARELDDMRERLGSGVPPLREGSSVVMAFTIAMPSPSRKRERDNASSSGASDRVSTLDPLHDTELGEYCIGSVEVLCSEDR